ncbi:MAG: hypothetical protein HKL85_08355 [Acidimicrobiaceae bacterium]|nr:hypothetical protein [Acidimicrobiaceae bacterium]
MPKVSKSPPTGPHLLEVMELNDLRRAQCVEAWATLARAGLKIPATKKERANENE